MALTIQTRSTHVMPCGYSGGGPHSSRSALHGGGACHGRGGGARCCGVAAAGDVRANGHVDRAGGAGPASADMRERIPSGPKQVSASLGGECWQLMSVRLSDGSLHPSGPFF